MVRNVRFLRFSLALVALMALMAVTPLVGAAPRAAETKNHLIGVPVNRSSICGQNVDAPQLQQPECDG